FLILSLLSISFHKSMLLPFLAYLISYYIKNTKVLLWIWLLSIPIGFSAGQSIEAFVGDLLMTDSLLGDTRADTYFSAEVNVFEVIPSFRWDFVFYSAAPILLGI